MNPFDLVVRPEVLQHAQFWFEAYFYAFSWIRHVCLPLDAFDLLEVFPKLVTVIAPRQLRPKSARVVLRQPSILPAVVVNEERYLQVSSLVISEAQVYLTSVRPSE